MELVAVGRREMSLDCGWGDTVACVRSAQERWDVSMTSITIRLNRRICRRKQRFSTNKYAHIGDNSPLWTMPGGSSAASSFGLFASAEGSGALQRCIGDGANFAKAAEGSFAPGRRKLLEADSATGGCRDEEKCCLDGLCRVHATGLDGINGSVGAAGGPTAGADRPGGDGGAWRDRCDARPARA